jgi:hypothetical protein
MSLETKKSGVLTFKDNINNFLNDNKIVPNEIIELAKFVNDNPYIIENIIEPPNPLRCIASCYNKKQCTKNKKFDSQFCGIHVKGTPYGIIAQKSDNIIKIDVSLIEIKGILCYIDTYNNVYQTEDIIQSKINPKIIAKWDGVNYIPL